MKIFQKIYAVWAITTLILTGLATSFLLVPGLLIPGRRARLEYNRALLMAWSRFWGWLACLFFRSKGEKKEARKETTIFVVNHGSYLDPPAAYSLIRQPFRTLAKKELTKIPFYARIVKSSCILIDRKDAASREAGYQTMLDALRNGESILIYPEGTQNRTGQPLKDFYDGAFRLAIDSGCPLQVIVCANASKLLPQAKMLQIRPGRVTYHWMDRIPTHQFSQEDIEPLKEKVRKMMWEKLESLQPH